MMDFPSFPHKPYDIQLQFMRSLYKVLDDGAIGLFESPTGTGKTLSLLCGALTWLERNQALPATQGAPQDDEDMPAWLQEAAEAVAAKRGRAALEAADDEEDAHQPKEKGPPTKRQLFFCSRTHSQLSQVVAELHRTPFASSMSAVMVASRGVLCANSSVRALGGAAAIADACQDLLQRRHKRTLTEHNGAKKGNTQKGACGCSLYATAKIDALRDAALATPMDVEDLGTLGRRMGACPYFAARSAVAEADVVLLPYSALLVKETREALGVHLDNSVVIFDEAHNVVNAVISSHAAVLTRADAGLAAEQLQAYVDRFRGQLAPANRVMAETLAHAANKLHNTGTTGSGTTLSSDALLTLANLDHVNPYTLLQWATEHKIVHKAASAHSTVHNRPTSRSSLYALLGFLRALGNDDGQGCVLCNASSLRYTLLDASVAFAPIVSAAHSVVLASGTLSPVDALTMQLFGPRCCTTHHAFSHVVPPHHVCTTVVSNLDLRYASRETEHSLSALRVTVDALAACTPHGLILFFPSFRYMQAAVKAGVGKTQHKPLFIEPTSAAEVPGVLAAYGAACTQGATLLSVCGGRLSEGINFADRLGRCVVLVGLPYPDGNDVEMQQRLALLAARHGEGVKRVVYEGACFTAVNQAVGRVLRHAQDYAAIVLLDGRYARALDKLPAWTTRDVAVVDSGNDAAQRLTGFFARDFT